MTTVIRHRKSLAIALGFVFSATALADDPKLVAYVSNKRAASPPSISNPWFQAALGVVVPQDLRQPQCTLTGYRRS